MINMTYAQTQLQSIFQGVVGGGIPVIIAEQSNAPKPLQRPYITLKILGPRQVGQHVQSAPDITGNSYIKVQYELSALVQAYGSGAIEALSKLDFSFNKQSIRDLLHAVGITWHNSSGIRDVTHFLDTKWEPVGTLTLGFYVADEETDEVGFIEHLNDVSGEIDGFDGDEIAISPINIDIN